MVNIMSNDKKTLAIIISDGRTTRTLASVEYTDKEYFIEPCPVPFGNLSARETDLMLRLADQVPRWIEQGMGRVVAYDMDALEVWARKVGAAVKRLEEADTSDDKRLAAIALHEVANSAR